MFKIKKELKGFVFGVLFTLLLTSTFAFAKQGEEMIAVSYNNIKILLNGSAIDLTDGEDSVEPFIYNSRTYLPVRVVSEALGLDVKWDGTTSTVKLTSILPKDPEVDPSPNGENPTSVVGKPWNGKDVLVTINGANVNNARFDAPPINGDGDLLVPVRLLTIIPNMSIALDEGLIDPDKPVGSSDISQWSIVFNDSLRLKYNDKTAYFSNGTIKQMPVAPIIHDGWTMVPIKFIVEQFGYNCSYNEAAKSITLVSK